MSERNLEARNMSPRHLVRKYNTSNATHNPKYIHTMRIHNNIIFNVCIYNLAQIELQLGAINAAEIAATTGLEIFGL
jgi:uridine kinase